MRWERVTIETADGPMEAIAPLVISASRSTDIPAFHAEWFMRRLRAGYVRWVNPFNQRPQYIAFKNVRAIVFWTKNPAPLLPFLPELDAREIPYYFQFTINDYACERLEPHVPDLESRIATFRQLSERLGAHRVIWRFDPLLLAAGVQPDDLIAKIRAIGDQLYAFTRKLVFSFADIDSYTNVSRNLRAAGMRYREFTLDEMLAMGEEIGRLCRGWGITPATCGEAIDLTPYGIEKNKCIDDALLLDITRDDPALVDLFGYSVNPQQNLFGACESRQHKAIKDPGQRKDCGCAFSKDIGQYNTCMHLCAYCYANSSPKTVRRIFHSRSVDGESVV